MSFNSNHENISLSAIKMLGDMLTEQEERINDANIATDDQLEADLENVDELWQLYLSLLARQGLIADYGAADADN